MCGICGFVTKKVINKQILKVMNDKMIHRGPDDSGEEIFEGKKGYSIGFAHRRLSILDLSYSGHQPMHSHDRRVSIIFNGEIYNFRELKNQLAEYPFVSTSDTEVLIASYLKWGKKFIEHVNGMFAIALYDRETQEVYLYRDRIGKKPVYYWIDGENIVFASELKSIMVFPNFDKIINKGILSRYLIQQYINAPDSIFEDVYKLEPGCMMTISPIKGICKSTLKIEKYWDVSTVYHGMQLNLVTDYEEAKEMLKHLLIEATKQRMIADVPVGTFLSGGYDSSLITAIAQSISDKPLKTFSIGFTELEKDEAPYARKIAEFLGTRHVEHYITEEEMLNQVVSIPMYYDEPFADSSQIPSMLVSELAKKDVTVVLTGDGGDEFYCGYNAYSDVLLAQRLNPIGHLVHEITNLPVLCRLNLEDKLPLKVQTISMNSVANTKVQFKSKFYKDVIESMLLPTEEARPFEYECEKEYAVKKWQIRRMLLDMDTYLPGDVLTKVDRATMKYALEARCPILDVDVMEYSYRIEHRFKYTKRNGKIDKKHILKDITYDYIPKELLERPKKGFSVPLSKWLQGSLKEKLLFYSDTEFIKKQDLFDEKQVKKYVTYFIENGDAGRGTGLNLSSVLWSFFIFQQWYQCYFEK